MAFSVQMPALGESVTEGTVTRWLKQEGDTVERDEPLLEVSTDKVDTEIPSPASGVLAKIVAQEDDTVEVGGELAVISEEGEFGGGRPAPEERPEERPAEDPAAQPEPAVRESEPEVSEPEPTPAAAPSSGGKATPVLMPELGESVTEGTVTRWLKRVADQVQADEPLVEVSTDKVDTEIPSPVSGTLLEITAEEDVTVSVGGELAKIGEPSAPTGEPAARPPPQPEPKPEPKPEERKPEPEPQPQPQPVLAVASLDTDGAPYVTPLVRKLAVEHNVDLGSVKGTGVGGRIRKQGVVAAAAGKEKETTPAEPTAAPAREPAAAPASALAHLRGTTQKASRIRQL